MPAHKRNNWAHGGAHKPNAYRSTVVVVWHYDTIRYTIPTIPTILSYKYSNYVKDRKYNRYLPPSQFTSPNR
eukprot:scaffold233_cov198-Chaetoceros_neogracile.AAC.10